LYFKPSEREMMKAGLIFFIAVILAVIFFSFYEDPLKVKLNGDWLEFYNRKCKQTLPVKVLEKEKDLIDVIELERILLEFRGIKFYLEIVDLPPKYAFDKPYGFIVEKIFKMKVKEVFSEKGVTIYKGDGFDIALFSKTNHDLVLLYPLPEALTSAIISCTKGEPKSLPNTLPQPKLIKSQWNMDLIILDNIINKDI